MQRIDSENVSETLPTPEAEGATVGYFKGPDGLGGSGTKITADWLNAVQEELANVIAEGGLTLDKSNNTQLKSAIVEIVKANSTDNAEVVDLISANAIHGTVGTTDSRLPTSSGVGGQSLKATQVEVSTDGQVGNVSSLAIGSALSAKNPSAALEVSSTTKGVLLPRLTTVQRSAISSPAEGLILHDTTQNRIVQRGSDGWRKVLAEEPSGAFGFPSLTQTERDAISSPFNGMMIFNSTKRDMQVYRNGWENIGTPAGNVSPFAGQTAPDGWLLCDGSLISRTVYSDLFRQIGVIHGVGDRSTTFAIPDYRGRFLRGAALGSSSDPDRASRTAPVSGTFTLTASATANGSSTVTVSSTANLAPGMTVSGTGIPASSVVRAILTSTTFQLGNTSRSSINATATSASVTLTFSNSATADFVGSVQSHGFEDHTHDILKSPYSTSNNGHTRVLKAWVNDGVGSESQATTGAGGGSETRPLNSNANFIIKY